VVAKGTTSLGYCNDMRAMHYPDTNRRRSSGSWSKWEEKQKSVPRLAWHYPISHISPPIMMQKDTVKRFFPAYVTEIILGQRWHTVDTNLYIADMSVKFINLGSRSSCHELARIVDRMSHQMQPVQAPHICCTSCLAQPHEASLGSRVCTVARNKQ
jgi:hypothetical protein